MTFRDVEKILLSDGWYRCKVTGAHYQYKHKTKPGKITVSRHCKEIKRTTVLTILKQAKIEKNNLKNL